MYYVGKFDESRFAVPHGYARNSRGYERADLVDHGVGSVHMGAGICRLQPQGGVESRIHANEKGIYVLEGELDGRTHFLPAMTIGPRKSAPPTSQTPRRNPSVDSRRRIQ